MVVPLLWLGLSQALLDTAMVLSSTRTLLPMTVTPPKRQSHSVLFRTVFGAPGTPRKPYTLPAQKRVPLWQAGSSASSGLLAVH